MFKWLTGYVESTVFCEIWLDYPLIDKEQKGVMNFSVLKTFLVVTSYATCYVNFSTVEQIFEKENQWK